jgi:hypothetical protein
MNTVFVRADLPPTSPFDVGIESARAPRAKGSWLPFGSVRGGSNASAAAAAAAGSSAPAPAATAAVVPTDDAGGDGGASSDEEGPVSTATAERSAAAKIWVENYFESLMRGTHTERERQTDRLTDKLLCL